METQNYDFIPFTLDKWRELEKQNIGAKIVTAENHYECELLCDDLTGDYPLLVKITDSDNEKYSEGYTKYGERFTGDDDVVDLRIAIPKPKEVTIKRWVNVYCKGDEYITGGTHTTKENAETAADLQNYITVEVLITFTDNRK